MTKFALLFLRCRLNFKKDTKITSCAGKWDVTLTHTTLSETKVIFPEQNLSEESVLSHLSEVYSAATQTEFPPPPNLLKLRYTILPVTAVQGQKDFLSRPLTQHSFCGDLKHMGFAFRHLPESCRKPVLGVCIWVTLRASLSDAFLQTLLDLVRPLKRHSYLRAAVHRRGQRPPSMSLSLSLSLSLYIYIYIYNLICL